MCHVPEQPPVALAPQATAADLPPVGIQQTWADLPPVSARSGSQSAPPADSQSTLSAVTSPGVGAKPPSASTLSPVPGKPLSAKALPPVPSDAALGPVPSRPPSTSRPSRVGAKPPPPVPGDPPSDTTVMGLEPVVGAPAATVMGLDAVPDRATPTDPHAFQSKADAAPSPGDDEPRQTVALGPKRTRKSGQHPRQTPAKSPRRPSSSARLRAAAPPEPSTTPDAPLTLEPGRMLGGLELLGRIGAGGMGTVWLARQLSLDRNVAVKILREKLSADPHFVLAFTREALAAAQLVHHNIAQIYDAGVDAGLHYFSMEFVDGESLSAVVKREGKLAPEVAAGYVLQAARGLKFAHERGMIHRDIKPENLLLNRDGIVKVADLGLVKRIEVADTAPRSTTSERAALQMSDIVMEGTAMGTPAFMAPEQARDSRGVDLRADIYSLGCTLYDLVTGRPPFKGDTAMEVMGKHFFEAPKPPEELAPRVPKSLSDIILCMMAKTPGERPQDMGEVITSLEGFLGIDGTQAFSPREEHAALLERSVARFNGARWAKVRGYGGAAFVGLSLGFAFDAAYLGAWGLAGFATAFALAAVLTSLLINAFVERGPLLMRLRQLGLAAGPIGWASAAVLLAIAIGVLAWFGQLRSVAEVLGLGTAAALLSFLFVDRRAAKEQRPEVEAVEAMLKAMRLKGLEELKLRQFVSKYAGDDWEPFYEQLFGYEAKLFARQRWGRDDRNQARRQRGVWRDPLIRVIDRWLDRRQQRRNEQQLQRLEADEQQRGAQPPPPPSEPL